MTDNRTFEASDGELIRTTIFGRENLGKAPCIVFVHGFKGFKDWGFWPYMGEFFASNGYAALSFNFSRNGVGESLTEFDELDKFAANTYSLEVRELSELIDALKDGFFGETKDQRIALLGHSRGGGITLACASRKSYVAAVALWASVAHFDRYSEHQKELWRKIGYLEIANQRTKQVMRLNSTILDDVERNKGDLLDLEKATRSLNRPLFIAHGQQDISVPPAEAKKLFSWSDRNKTELYLIPGTGHTFGIVHPFAGSSKAFETLLSRTESFFATSLCKA